MIYIAGRLGILPDIKQPTQIICYIATQGNSEKPKQTISLEKIRNDL